MQYGTGGRVDSSIDQVQRERDLRASVLSVPVSSVSIWGGMGSAPKDRSILIATGTRSLIVHYSNLSGGVWINAASGKMMKSTDVLDWKWVELP